MNHICDKCHQPWTCEDPENCEYIVPTPSCPECNIKMIEELREAYPINTKHE